MPYRAPCSPPRTLTGTLRLRARSHHGLACLSRPSRLGCDFRASPGQMRVPPRQLRACHAAPPPHSPLGTLGAPSLPFSQHTCRHPRRAPGSARRGRQSARGAAASAVQQEQQAARARDAQARGWQHRRGDGRRNRRQRAPHGRQRDGQRQQRARRRQPRRAQAQHRRRRAHAQHPGSRGANVTKARWLRTASRLCAALLGRTAAAA